MIRLERPAEPAAFRKRTRAGKERARDFYALPLDQRAHRRFDFDDYPKRAARKELEVMNQFKCAFCESPLTDPTSEVENFRPCQGVIGAERQVFPDLYWWLAASWDNLHLVCAECSRYRGTRFPLVNEKARATAPGEEAREEPLLIDPCREDPADHLVFAEDGQVVPRLKHGRPPSRKGLATIEAFGLNRPALVEWRFQRARELRERLEEWEMKIDIIRNGPKPVEERLKRYGRKLRDEAGEFLSPEFPFVALGRQIFRQEIASWSKKVRELIFPERRLDWWIAQALEAKAVPETSVVRAVKRYRQRRKSAPAERQSVWIRRIEIENFKSIERLVLDLPEGAADSKGWPWLMLLGENSSAKTTVLEAVAVALAGETYLDMCHLDPARFLRRVAGPARLQPASARVCVYFTGGAPPVEVRLRRQGAPRYSGAKSPVLLMAYGATRLLPRGGHEAEGEHSFPIRAGNLFDPFLPLRSPEDWATDRAEVGLAEFGSMAMALRKLLPDVPEDWLRRETGELFAELNGVRYCLKELSAGYQTVVALALDIYKGLRRHFRDVELAEGVVLLDEVGEHLHPRWKKRIVADLRAVFPRVQFIATTHDPLCLRGLRGNEVILLRRTPAGAVEQVKDLPPVEGMRVDQILQSEHFGLGSVYDDDTEKLFRDYYALLAKPQLTPEEEAQKAKLRDAVNQREVLARTRRERLFVDVVDRFLARQAHAEGETDRRKAGADMDAELKQIWKELGLPGGSPQ